MQKVFVSAGIIILLSSLVFAHTVTTFKGQSSGSSYSLAVPQPAEPEPSQPHISGPGFSGDATPVDVKEESCGCVWHGYSLVVKDSSGTYEHIIASYFDPASHQTSWAYFYTCTMRDGSTTEGGEPLTVASTFKVSDGGKFSGVYTNTLNTVSEGTYPY